MKHNLYKKAALLAFSVLLVSTAFAQKETRNESSVIRIETKNIKKDISNAVRSVASEIRRIDFEKIGAALASAAAEIEREVGDVEVIVEDSRSSRDRNGKFETPGVAEASKTISKTYNIGKNDKLSINNQYGRVSVHTWNKNEIKVDIEVKAFESSESTAKDLLESVTITDTRQSDLISFKTTFEKTSMSFWSRVRNGKEERRGVQVNYEIYMPAKNALDITNRYGGTILPDFAGPINITSAYGSFAAGKLDNAANQVKVSYGSAVMENYSNGNLAVSYGSLKLANANKVNATIKYSGAKIARLTTGGTFDLSYSGGFKIDDVDRNVKNLVINSSYSGITLGIDENADFDFDVTVSYAGFNFDNDKISLATPLNDPGKSKTWTPTKNYKGTVGKGSDSRIIIKSNYGGVKFL